MMKLERACPPTLAPPTTGRCVKAARAYSFVAIVPRRSAMATVLCCWTYCIPGMSFFNIYGFGSVVHVSCLELLATAGACPCWCVGCLCEMDVCSLSKSIRQNVAATGVVQISPPLLRAAQVRRQFGVCTLTCGLIVWVATSFSVAYNAPEVARTMFLLFPNTRVFELFNIEAQEVRTSRAYRRYEVTDGLDTDALYYAVVVAVGAAYCWWNCCARRADDDESLVLPTRALNPVAGVSSSLPPLPTLQQERLLVFVVTGVRRLTFMVVCDRCARAGGQADGPNLERSLSAEDPLATTSDAPPAPAPQVMTINAVAAPGLTAPTEGRPVSIYD